MPIFCRNNFVIVPPAPALKLLFQKKKSVLTKSYKYLILISYYYISYTIVRYIYYSQLKFLLPFRWQLYVNKYKIVIVARIIFRHHFQ